jgi:tetratricopeptide (TPR) repeat protein
MSEAHRSDAHDAGSDRDAKIEQLLLVGLDHYFAARYELAINVWTRALFLDRSHARARAYIDRARSALAERQRESEELLHTGVAAFERGDADEARRLLHAAIDGGAPSEEALAVLDRLNRLETVVLPAASAQTGRTVRERPVRPSDGRRRSFASVTLTLLALAAIAAGGFAARFWDASTWTSIVTLVRSAGDAALAPAQVPMAPIPRDAALALPQHGETTLTRARTLIASGHLRDALAALETVRPTDVQKGEADRLRADIQRQLLALTLVPPPADADREKGDRRVP